MSGSFKLGETTEQAAQRGTGDETCATIEINRRLAMYSAARIGRLQIICRARLVNADTAVGVESEKVALLGKCETNGEATKTPSSVPS